MKNNWRIVFRFQNIYLMNNETNEEIPIHHLIEFLKSFSVWYPENVPEQYYSAWKILVLGSNEYDEHAVETIKIANTNLLTK